ncbi:MAG: hypothetical protein KDD84_24705, partial [Caldilineaceae bacterium]|nr:hypothetical protein [Caldilineaceae bacterium]
QVDVLHSPGIQRAAERLFLVVRRPPRTTLYPAPPRYRSIHGDAHGDAHVDAVTYLDAGGFGLILQRRER